MKTSTSASESLICKKTIISTSVRRYSASVVQTRNKRQPSVKKLSFPKFDIVFSISPKVMKSMVIYSHGLTLKNVEGQNIWE